MHTRSLIRLVVVPALLLTACGPSTPATIAPTQATPSTGQTATTPGSAAAGPASATPAPSRRATLSELWNDVLARASEAAGLAPAAEGEALGPGGQVRTGEDSKVRIDLTEGTIVRLAPMSEFTVSELDPDAASPFTRLSLAAGKVWVILSGGALEVETPLGVATVRGSYLGVDYYPEYNVLVVTCLEGHCALKNDAGTTELTDGQAASVSGESLPPSSARPMTGAEVQQWTDENPEAAQVAPTREPGVEAPAAPTAEGTPLPPPGASAPGGAPPPVNTSPNQYNLINPCVNDLGTWHVIFAGLITVQVDIPPGETRSGKIPNGNYTVTEWEDNTPFNASSHMNPGDDLTIPHACGIPLDSSPPPP